MPAQTVYGTLHIPGGLGGGNWWSLAVHPHRQVAILPINHLLEGKH